MLLWPLRIFLKVVGLIVGAVVVYLVVTGVQIWMTSLQYSPQDAGAIVVMGAAQVNGVPSPDLQARLEEALALFQQGYSHLIVCTGSKKAGEHYTEAQVGFLYLTEHGVPAADVLQGGGTTTYADLTDAQKLLAPRHMKEVLISTDPFQEYRSEAIASSLGLDPHPTPTRNSPIKGWSTVPYYLRETASVALGRIIGYSNATRVHSTIG